MKQLIFILLFACCTCTLLKAQDGPDKRIFVKFNIEYLAGLSYNIEGDEGLFDYDSFYGKNLEIGCGYNFTKQFSTSLNIGANRYEKLSANTFPITIQACYYLKPKLNSFFGTLKAGPQIKFSDASDKGYVLAVNLGRRFKIKNNFAAKAYVGFNYQKTMEEYVNMGKVNRNSLVFGVEIPVF
ncbi:MAG: hypothetical protein ACK5MI_05190 [Mangrovibacterium sp.]